MTWRGDGDDDDGDDDGDDGGRPAEVQIICVIIWHGNIQPSMYVCMCMYVIICVWQYGMAPPTCNM